MSDSTWIVDVTDETFQSVVLDGSSKVPVVIDFWAEWCGPCKLLAPILDKLAEEYKGRFLLAKVDIEQCQQIAGAFGIQSIPLVVAMIDGQPVNQFAGALPEEQIREWIDSVVPSPADELLNEGMNLEEADPAAAEAKYRAVLELEPAAGQVKAMLARTLLAQDRDDECRRLIADLETRGFLEPDAERVKSELELRSVVEEAGDVVAARQAATEAPDDLNLQLKLAEALIGTNKYEEALQLGIEIVARDKTGVGVEAKSVMVHLFDKLGAGSELVTEYRRKLATVLY
ncbi:MAG: thioredoxin [Planctomycetota bacterium]|nr:thioredoxin [Planctomycetota bacterium]